VRLVLFTECNALKSAIPSTPSTTASPPRLRSFDTESGVLVLASVGIFLAHAVDTYRAQ